MIRNLVLGLAAAVVLSACAHGFGDARGGSDEYLFVQVVGGGSVDGERLVLEDVAAQTVFFADRPRRVAGHLPVAEFVAGWTQGADSFAADPPNASLAFVSGGVESAVTLELHDPVLDGDRLAFRVRVLGGTLPATFDDASLFIDAGGIMQLVAYGSQ